MSDEPAPPEPNLAADSITEVLGKTCGIPDCYVAFKGYLGGPNECDMRRIYLDNSFCRWLEVAADDIKHREDVPANERDPRSVFWVERCAKVIVCRVYKAHELENESTMPPDDAGAYRHPPW